MPSQICLQIRLCPGAIGCATRCSTKRSSAVGRRQVARHTPEEAIKWTTFLRLPALGDREPDTPHSGEAGKIVLITGGTSGNGYALAAKFRAQGDRVIICARDHYGLAAIRTKFPGVTVIPCDVTVPDQVGHMLSQIDERFGRIDILVNAAGQFVERDFADQASLDGISQEIELNLSAPINLIDLAMPLLKNSKSATIVFITSGHSMASAVHAPVHAAAHAGLRAFARSVRTQMACMGIRVVEVVAPFVEPRRMKTPVGLPRRVVASATLHLLGGAASKFMSGRLRRRNRSRTWQRTARHRSRRL